MHADVYISKAKKKLTVYRRSEKQHRNTVYKIIKTLNQTNTCEHTLRTDLIAWFPAEHVRSPAQLSGVWITHADMLTLWPRH